MYLPRNRIIYVVGILSQAATAYQPAHRQHSRTTASGLSWQVFCAGALLLGCLLRATGLSAAPLGLPEPPVPSDNLQTPAKIALGDRLFHDPRLSANGQVSCAACHRAEQALADGPRAVSVGVGGAQGARNAPTVANAVYLSSQFWDGRSPSLEAQALEPLVNPVEMGFPNLEAALHVIRSDESYRAAFREAFGIEPENISGREVAQAIASYERTLIFGDSPFDRYQYLGEKDAMTPAAVRGLAVFMAWGRCTLCHSIGTREALFTDNRFHNIGIGINRFPDALEAHATAKQPVAQRKGKSGKVPSRQLLDSELGRFAVTRKIDDLGAFKTPSLRNVALTGPYMHDGSIKTLRDVVIHYALGGFSPGDVARNEHMDPDIQFLELSNQQVDDLVAFLEALTSPQLTTPSSKPVPPSPSPNDAAAVSPTDDASSPQTDKAKAPK